MTAKKIIVAYDGSPDSNKALQLAAELAKGLAMTIDLVTVVAAPELSSEVRHFEGQKAVLRQTGELRIATGIQQAEALGITAAGILLEGNVPEQIIHYAANEQAFLIVVGTRGLGGFAELVLGSVARALVKHSSTSVLVAK